MYFGVPTFRSRHKQKCNNFISTLDSKTYFIESGCCSVCLTIVEIYKRFGSAFIQTAWSNVSQSNIQNYFAKAGFNKNKDASNLFKNKYEEDIMPLSALANFIKKNYSKEVCDKVKDTKFTNLDEGIFTEELCMWF